MARWVEIRSELLCYAGIARGDGVDIVVDLDGDEVEVHIRPFWARGLEWIQVLVDLGAVAEVTLEALVRRSDAVLGAIVIEDDRCLLRESAWLEPLAPVHVHGLIELALSQAAAVQAADVLT